MSLQATLSNALSGLGAAQRALASTAHNVANANTEGYTRKVATQEAAVVGGRGAGVRPLDAQRVVDEFLDAELRSQKGGLARSDAISGYHDRIQETLFGAPGDAGRGLAARVSGLATAAEALANAPETGAARVALIGAVQDLTRQLAGDAVAVQALRRDADREVGQVVDAVNADLKALHALNGELARGPASPDLLDRRDRLLAGLAERLPISVVPQEDGVVSVFALGGAAALLEREPAHLDYEPAGVVGEATSFGPIRLYRADDIDPGSGSPVAGARSVTLVTGGARAELTPELLADPTPDSAQVVRSPFATGRLQGLLEVRDRLLPGLADQLGELAGVVRFALNAAHNDAVPRPLPGTLAGTRTDHAGWDGAANAGTARLAVVDRATGATLATLEIDVTAASPAALAAALDADLGGLGNAALDVQGRLNINLDDAAYGLALDEGDSRIPVTGVAGPARDYGFAHYFGLNDLVVPTGAGRASLAVRPDIQADPAKLSAVALTVDPGPPMDATVGGVGDNRPAKALAAALARGIDTVARGTLPARRATMGGYVAEVTAAAAAGAERAASELAGRQASVEDLAFHQGAVSGVNVDEELSRLVTYQQAYTVSARIISITNELFDELFSITR